MASAYLHRTNGTPTNSQKMTFSTWFKIGTQASQQSLFGTLTGGGPYTQVKIMALATHNNVFRFEAESVEGNAIDLKTNRALRDCGAWYHLVIGIDTTQSVAADRTKIYINGVQETSFATSTYPTLNDTLDYSKSGTVAQIMAYNNTEHWNGVFAHTHFIDGLQYAASDFGETDSTSGIWVAKTGPSVTYGDNGFFLKYVSGAITTDSSGEGNTMTQVGTITTTKDTPDNNFCTINPLDDYYQESTYSNGNTKVVTESGSAVYAFNTATMGVSSGKWYWEMKMTNSTSAGANFYGVAAEFATSASTELGQTTNQLGFLNNNTTRTNNTGTAFGDTGGFTTGDIMGCALDMTNSRIFFAKNGVWMTPSATSGGDPTDGTGAVALPTAVASTVIGAYLPAFGSYVNDAQTYEVNFGNGYFGTTLDGTNADDAGIGLFKYDVPTGFYALCTNNLGDQS